MTGKLFKNNFDIFKEGYADNTTCNLLSNKGYVFLSPMPALSTHLSVPFLSPFVNWKKLHESYNEQKGKNLKIWCGRSDLIGDTVMALPMLHYFEKEYPQSYKYWSILRKCSQAAPLYFNHPLIDKIFISDYQEGFGENDYNVAKNCDVVINTRPEHRYVDWHNKYSMGKETWLMAGLPEEYYDSLTNEEKTPKFYRWFDNQKHYKTIAIHCFAGYGRDNQRSPSIQWWEKIIIDLVKLGYKIIRLGYPSEPMINFPQFHHSLLGGSISKCQDLRSLSFIEQIQIALGCSTYIGTDSGFSLVIGAYSHPQITLLTNWNIGHKTNLHCLAPMNKNNINLFNDIKFGGCSNILQEKVLESLNNLL